MPNCLFCDIVAGRIPCEEVYADAEILAFRDINPQAPVHVLVIPKRHIASAADLEEPDAAIMGRLILVASRLAAELGLAEAGYRWVINCGADGGQAVGHIHLHLLGGRSMKWPPG
jgi:histidine triad (HIT) family protein